jgi:hypothetical protein
MLRLVAWVASGLSNGMLLSVLSCFVVVTSKRSDGLPTKAMPGLRSAVMCDGAEMSRAEVLCP